MVAANNYRTITIAAVKLLQLMRYFVLALKLGAACAVPIANKERKRIKLFHVERVCSCNLLSYFNCKGVNQPI